MYHMYDSLIRYDLYDIHLCIGRFTSTYDIHLQYETFCTQYDTYRISYDTNNYTHTYFIKKKTKNYCLNTHTKWAPNVYYVFVF